MQTFPPNFLVRNFSVNWQFPRIFGRISRKNAETVPLRKIYLQGNWVEKLVFYTVKNINNL